MIPLINRAAIIIWHKEAYFQWTESLDGDRPNSNEGNLYLIEDLQTGSPEEAGQLIRKYWREIAEEEFEAWCTDDEAWPRLKSIKDFGEYFRWEVRDMIHDLCDEPIEHDDEDLPGETGVNPTLN